MQATLTMPWLRRSSRWAGGPAESGVKALPGGDRIRCAAGGRVFRFSAISVAFQQTSGSAASGRRPRRLLLYGFG